MKSTLLVYGSIWEYSASDFVEGVSKLNEKDELMVRLNSNGGSPEYAWSMISALQDFKGKKELKVEGKAYSMGAFFPLYFDNVEALDITEFMFHRAAYPSFIENDPERFTAEMKGNLDRVNQNLRKALENKIDVAAFEKQTKVTIDEIFSMETRKDVFLTAEQAKKIGLISKITAITPTRAKEINAEMVKISAQYFVPLNENDTNEKQANQNHNNSNNQEKMNLEELKTKHPELHAEVVALGVNQERERVKAFSKFYDVDAEGVKKAINDGTAITVEVMVEFAEKAGAHKQLESLKKDGKLAENTDGAGQNDTDLGANGAGSEEKTEFEQKLEAVNSLLSEKK